MKLSNKFLAIVLVLSSFSAFAEPPQAEASVTLGNMNKNNQVMVKVSKVMMGADVYVYHASGDLVAANKMSRKKMVIDFQNARFGSYVILVKKGHYTEEFQYDKELLISQVIR